MSCELGNLITLMLFVLSMGAPIVPLVALLSCLVSIFFLLIVGHENEDLRVASMGGQSLEVTALVNSVAIVV